jgi:amino acid transporter
MGLAASLGAGSLWLMGVAASAPVVVLVGGVTTMYAATGLRAVPAAFLVLAVALVPVTGAVVAASRHLDNAATCYSVLARGLSPVAGVAGGLVALVSYIAIACSLYGLLGSVLASAVGGPWWAWAVGAWAVVSLLGGVSLPTNVTVIGVGVVVQLGTVAAVVWSALSRPGASFDLAGLSPAHLSANGAAGLGGVLAFGIAAFIGFESPASYVEETRNPRSVLVACFAALGFLGVCYAVTAWAVQVGYGPGRVVAAAQDPGSGMPLGLLGGYAPVGELVLVVSIGLSLLSFHHLAARYLYRLGWDGVLPRWLARIGHGLRAGAPMAASSTQSALTLAVIAVAGIAGVDPFTGLFVPTSTLAAVGVLLVLTVSSAAAGRFFARGGGTRESWWTRRVAPGLGVVCGGSVLSVVVANLHSLLGVAPGATSTWALPAVVGLVALLGVVRAWWMRRRRRGAFELVGVGSGHHATRLDPRLAELPL